MTGPRRPRAADTALTRPLAGFVIAWATRWRKLDAVPSCAYIVRMASKPLRQNESARRKPTNLSLNSDLLREARAMRLNLSQILEQRLTELLREYRRREWLRENREAIEDYNRRIERRGVFSDGWRRF